MRLNRFQIFLFCGFVSLGLASILHAEQISLPDCSQEDKCMRVESYRGWDYLAWLLLKQGHSASTVRSIFQDRRLPAFTPVEFKLKPREPASIYRAFLSEKRLTPGRKFLDRYRNTFQNAEEGYEVSRCVITAILLVESGFGANTGKDRVFHRLARVSSVKDPDNLRHNYEIHSSEDSSISLSDVVDRANYLESTFFPEIEALIEIQNKQSIDLYRIYGSRAGAFGWPQFLPSNYIRFGQDGGGDGKISLYDPQDAIYSVANFLKHFGWKDNLSREQKESVLWNYNRSQPYVETILNVARDLGKCSNN